MHRARASTLCRRGASLLRSFATGPASGVLEYRQYTLHPSGFKDFFALTNEHAELRKRLNPGFLGCVHARVALLHARADVRHSMFTADTGGVLHKVHHFYHYCSMEERATVRRALAASGEWQQQYIDRARPLVAHQVRSRAAASRLGAAAEWHPQESMILLQAPDVHAAAGIPSVEAFQARIAARSLSARGS